MDSAIEAEDETKIKFYGKAKQKLEEKIAQGTRKWYSHKTKENSNKREFLNEFRKHVLQDPKAIHSKIDQQ